MKNEELAKDYTANIEIITKDDYLQREYYDKSPEYKQKTLDNILLQRNYLKKYKKDFMTHFRKDYMNQYKRKTDAFVLPASCAFTGSIITFIYIFSAENLYPSVLSIFIGITILPAIIECVILPIYKSHKRYNTYLNNIDTKLEIIKNYQKENEFEETHKASKKIDRVDSFIREIVKDKDRLEGLNTHDKVYFRDKLMAIAKEYIELTFTTETKITGPTLKDNKELERLYKELIAVEEEIEVSHKKEKNIEVLTDTFGDITKLDTSIVELNTSLDSALKLDRKITK